MSRQRRPTAKVGVGVAVGRTELRGTVRHDDARHLLLPLTEEGPAGLSTNLETYGRTPGPGNVFIKNWSEHRGLATHLEHLDW